MNGCSDLLVDVFGKEAGTFLFRNCLVGGCPQPIRCWLQLIASRLGMLARLQVAFLCGGVAVEVGGIVELEDPYIDGHCFTPSSPFRMVFVRNKLHYENLERQFLL